MVKNLLSGSDQSSDQDSQSNEESNTETPDTTDNETEFEDLHREEQLRMMFENAPEAYHHLKNEWEEEQAQVYFLVFSFFMCGVGLFLLLQNQILLLFAAIALYVIVVLPLLYIYEEETYFQSDKIPQSKKD